MRSQSVISNAGRGGRRYSPNAFTEHGVAMLSSALKSERAVQMNIVIVRAFVKLREILASHKELASRLTGGVSTVGSKDGITPYTVTTPGKDDNPNDKLTYYMQHPQK